MVVDYNRDVIFDWHAHDRSNISVVLSGAVTEDAESVESAAPHDCCSVVLKPSRTVHRNRFSPTGARLLTVVFDRELSEHLELHHDSRNRYRWTTDCALAAASLRLLDQVSRGTDRNGPRCALNTFVHAVTVQVQRSHRSASGEQPPHWLVAARTILLNVDQCPIRIDTLALGVGVHPVSLNRAFRKFYNCSVSDFRQVCQVRAAAQQLANGISPVAQIALDVGFADQSHLTRAFRRRFQVTPGRYRQFISTA